MRQAAPTLQPVAPAMLQDPLVLRQVRAARRRQKIPANTAFGLREEHATGSESRVLQDRTRGATALDRRNRNTLSWLERTWHTWTSAKAIRLCSSTASSRRPICGGTSSRTCCPSAAASHRGSRLLLGAAASRQGEGPKHLRFTGAIGPFQASPACQCSPGHATCPSGGTRRCGRGRGVLRKMDVY